MGTIIKQQKNIERLIARCESILSEKVTFKGQEWKLAKYVVALDQQIKEIEKHSTIDPDRLKSYQQRAGVLREVLRNEEEPQGLFSTSMNSSIGESFQSSPPSSSSSSFHLPSSTRGNKLLIKANNRRLSNMREQLFAKSSASGDEGENATAMRQRMGGKGDLESVLRHHEKIQEGVAEDMMNIARSLKNNSLVAKRIILSDNRLLEETTKKADENIDAVETATDRLKKHNSRCNWGIWLMLVTVFLVFVAMVIFIRIVPKPRT